MTGGFGANLAVSFLFGTNQLLWLIVVLFAGAFGVAWFAVKEGQRVRTADQREEVSPRAIPPPDASGIIGTIRASRYLKALAALLFISVIVSTLIDYQFKAAAKEAYPSADALASFFGSYYAWLSSVTMLLQVWLTGRLLMGLGITPSLLILPVTLLAGSISLLVLPGLFTATATRLAEASLRTSINDSAVEVLYLPIPDFIKKKVKVFLDVTIERLGDATAAIVILFCTFYLGKSDISRGQLFFYSVSFLSGRVLFSPSAKATWTPCAGVWHPVKYPFEETRIDFTDKETVRSGIENLGGQRRAVRHFWAKSSRSN